MSARPVPAELGWSSERGLRAPEPPAARAPSALERAARKLPDLPELGPQCHLGDDSSLSPAAIVVPVEPRGEPQALESLARLEYPPGKLEVLVARGTSPAAQRNAAARTTRAEYLLFLDKDCDAPADLLHLHVKALEGDPRLAAAGGPAVHRDRTPFAALASLVLSEPLALGRSASRYAPRGRARASDERELILCNLCVRRSAFEEARGFREDLYPSEENELLERFARAGWRLLYLPEARVERPQRESLGELLAAVYRYGRGRAAQARRRLGPASASRLALACAFAGAALAAALAPFLGHPWLALPAAGYAVYLAGLAGRFRARGVRPARAVLAALLAGAVHGAYALGCLSGLVTPRRVRGEVVALERHRPPGLPRRTSLFLGEPRLSRGAP